MKSPGRNDPCPCGSGRKFKHCCGREASPSAPRSLTAPSIHQALQWHRSGRLDEAAALYRQILERVPDQPDALHYLGLIAHQSGNNARALELVRKAASIDPTSGKFCNLGLILNAEGRYREAAQSFRKALALQADCAEAFNGLGLVNQSEGRLEEATDCCRKALSIDPRYAEAHNNLGGALKSSGALGDAVGSYRHAVEINPRYAEAISNLGIALQAQGALDEAAERYRAALALDSGLVQTRYNLGVVLQRQGRLQEALECFGKVLESSPRMAEAHMAMAAAVSRQGNHAQALAHYGSALDAAPESIAPHVERAHLLELAVPPWHVPMMNDAARNEAYRAALAAAIGTDSRVLEIGTGAGLLAMMAARQGAHSVTTCEAQPLIAEAARRIVAENGLEGRIRLFAKRSQDLVPGEDLPERADVLVTEIFSNELLAENALPSIEDAKQRLLKPEARIIPCGASIMIALFGGEQIGKNYAVQECCGFDVSHFNSLVPRKHVLARSDLPIEWLSDDIEAFGFDFQRHSRFPEESRLLRVPVTSSGCCHGVIQWIRLRLDAHAVFENHPRSQSAASGWQHCVYLFERTVGVQPGDVVIVRASHDRLWPWFSVEAVEQTTQKRAAN